MDLIVGFVKSNDDFATCVFSGNYNETILSKRAFTNLMGDEIKILSIFFDNGPFVNEVHKSLQEQNLDCKTVGQARTTASPARWRTKAA